MLTYRARMGGGPTAGAAPRAAVVQRRRLVDRLAGRFDARLTLVIGGGGSGKTTALAQAMAAESDNLDVWYPCTSADRDAETLLAGVAMATYRTVGGADPSSPDSPEPIGSIHDAVVAASPQHVCLVLDDVQLVDDPSGIDAVLARLPSNGHLLLAGRRRPGLPTARLDAAGALVELTQDDLLLTDGELVEFANLRGVDVESLRAAEGWPAFVELASSGIEVRSRRYLEEEALAGLDADRRHALALFAAVGGGDDALAQAVTGWSLAQLVHDLPLVRWSGEVAQLHDLWRDLLATEITEDDRHAAAAAAAEVLRRAGDVDRAIEVAAAVGAWDDVADTVSVAVRAGVDGGIRTDQLQRWRSLLPDEYRDAGVAVLIDALLERERDPTSVEAERMFDRAARQLDDEGDDALQLAALAQLGYLARIRADIPAIDAVMARVRTLGDRFPLAMPFLEFGEAWKALNTNDPNRQLAAMERIADRQLPPVWEVTRDHLIANALNSLGRSHEAIEIVPTNIANLAVPIPGALGTEAQSYWQAGQPLRAMEVHPRTVSAAYGARDRFLGAAWDGATQAWMGRTDEAAESVRVAVSQLGEQPAPILLAQTAGVELLIALAEGREDDATATLQTILDAAPLEEGLSANVLRAHLAVAYVLLAETRPFWHSEGFGGMHRTRLRIVEMFVRARERVDLAPISRTAWPEPGVVAVTLPCPWAMEFALWGVRCGRHEARTLAAWLCEHQSAPALAALRRWLDDDELGDAAADVIARTPAPPDQVVELHVLGDVDLRQGGYASASPEWRRERVRALLVWLVMNPNATREQAASALWPDLPADRGAKNLRTTLNYLHDVLEPQRDSGDATWFVRVDGHRIRLHESLDVDLWRFGDLLDQADLAERAGHPREALPLLVEATALWGGDLAADLDYEWLELERIHARSRFVRASCRAAELLVATDSPGEAIEVITPALTADPYHEPSYRALATAYAELGDITSSRAVRRRAEAVLAEL